MLSLRTRGWIPWLIAYLGVFLSRLLFLLWPYPNVVRNGDELIVTFACLDRFLALRPTNLNTPTTVLEFLAVPFFALDQLLKTGFSAHPPEALSRLVVYLGQAYADPRHNLLLLRLIVMLICSAAPLLCYSLARELSGSVPIALICAWLLSFQTSFFAFSKTAAGEALSVTFALAAFCVLLRGGSPFGAGAAGLLFGTAMGAKITIASLAVLGLLWLLSEGFQRLRNAASYCLGIFLGFLFWCPYVWTDPVFYAKTLAGNVHNESASFNLAASFELGNEELGIALTFLFLLVSALGLTLLFTSFPKARLVAALATVVIVAIPVLQAGAGAGTRYFFPLVPATLVLAALVSAGLQGHWSRWTKPWTILLVLVAGGAFAETMVQEITQQPPTDSELRQALAFIRQLPPDTAVYLPEEIMQVFPVELPREVYDRMLQRATAKVQDGTETVKFLQAAGIAKSTARALLNNFNEDEQALAARLAVLQATARPGSRPVYLYQDANYGFPRTANFDLTMATALQQVAAEKNAAILFPDDVPGLGRPIWQGENGWRWYRVKR